MMVDRELRQLRELQRIAKSQDKFKKNTRKIPDKNNC